MSPDAGDLDALRGLLEGVPDGREAFARRFAPLVRWTVGRTLPRAPGAVREEAEQEAFLALFEDGMRRLRQYDPARGRLSSWVALVARQAALRQAQRRVPEAPAVAEPLSPGPAPDGIAERGEELRRLREALASLSAREALCLALLVEQGMPPDAVARVLRTGRRTVYDLRDRALARLKARLESPNPPHGGPSGA